jgi:alpha-tubulin suppressor-like RCC1 family protein
LTACSDNPSGPAPAAEVTLSGGGTELTVGQSVQLTATVKDGKGRPLAGRPVQWSSENEVIAKVDQAGLVSAVAPGLATIRGTVEGVSNTIRITIRPVPVASVTISPDSLVVEPGDTARLAATPLDAAGNPLIGRQISWASSDTSLATVSSTGTVRVIGVGKVTITASSEGKLGQARIEGRRSVPDGPRLAAGDGFTCALDRAGAAYCWGDNSEGRLGTGTTVGSLDPVPVTGGHLFRAIYAGGATACGLDRAGGIFCWGRRLGLVGFSPVPERIDTNIVLESLSVSPRHACGVSKAGAGYCWGANDSGVLGNRGTAPRSAPTPVEGGIVFRSISTGTDGTCGTSASGLTYCWGVYSWVGLQGSVSYVPLQHPQGRSFTSTTNGFEFACGLDAEGAAHCWSRNNFGVLGNGTTTDAATAVPVSGGLRMRAIAASRENNVFASVCALTLEGAPYCWGSNSVGQLGSNTATQRCTRINGSLSSDCATTPQPVLGGLKAGTIVVGGRHVCVITLDQKIFCWGNNTNGQLGNGSTTNSVTPVLSRFNL